MPSSHIFPSLHIYGTSLLNAPSPQTILYFFFPLISFFPPHTKFHSLLLSLILPLQQKTLLRSSYCTQPIFPGIKSTAALLECLNSTRIVGNLKKIKPTHTRHLGSEQHCSKIKVWFAFFFFKIMKRLFKIMNI